MDANDTSYEITLLVEEPKGSGKYVEQKKPYGEWVTNNTKLIKKVHYDKKDKYYYRNYFNFDKVKRGREQFEKIDKILEEKGIALDRDLIVYRKGHESLEDIQNNFVRFGYTSTAAINKINKKTPGGLMLGDNEFEIIVPAGMKFLPIKEVAEEQVKKQNEIVLPRGISYELVEDKSIKGGAFYVEGKGYNFIKSKNIYKVKAKKN